LAGGAQRVAAVRAEPAKVEVGQAGAGRPGAASGADEGVVRHHLPARVAVRLAVLLRRKARAQVGVPYWRGRALPRYPRAWAVPPLRGWEQMQSRSPPPGLAVRADPRQQPQHALNWLLLRSGLRFAVNSLPKMAVRARDQSVGTRKRGFR